MIARSALVACVVAGCGVDELQTSSTTQEIWNIAATDPFFVGWESYVAPSPWVSLDCQPSSSPFHLLAGLKAWREPAGNWDRFIAKLEAHCYEYSFLGATLSQTGAFDPFILYPASTYPVPEDSIGIPSVTVPIGVRLRVNRFDGYVKNVAMRYGKVVGVGPNAFIEGYDDDADDDGYEDILTGDWATSLPGSPIDYLKCPEQYVVTSISVRPTAEGKIRALRIQCAEVDNW